MQSCRQSAALENKVSLVCPGLLSPPGSEQTDRRRYPVIEKFLGCAERTESADSGLEALCYRLFGYHRGEPPPAGALSALASALLDAGDENHWALATPAHVIADRTRLRLLDPEVALTEVQSDRLVDALNTHFQPQGLQFHAVSARQWLLKSRRPLPVEPLSYAQMLGRPIAVQTADDTQDRRWPALLNEIQMLLFAHPVNQQREAEGLLAVNSLWCWGGGRLPASAGPCVQQVYADLPFVKGLAVHNRVASDTAAAFGDALSSGTLPAGHLLCVDTGLVDTLTGRRTPQAAQGLARLEQTVFPRLIEALKAGVLDRVVLYCLGRYDFILERRAWYRLWSRLRCRFRRRPLDAWGRAG